MKKTIYITEPDVINLEPIENLLSEYETVKGDTSFSHPPADCSIIVIRSATSVDTKIKDKFPMLRHIIRIGVGVDNIDVEFCNKEGIAIYNAQGANADAVSDYVIAMMFVALRKINLLTPNDVETWNRFKFTGHNMSNRMVGIIGFGNIGRQIFQKLQGFGCKDFFAYDPFVKAEDMPNGVTYASSVEDVMRNSDVITLHVPLIPSTEYLINRNNLSLLKKGSVLLNASRGGIVNEADIIGYIQSNDITYIADTIENEPHIDQNLLNKDKIIITPHIASLTAESEESMVSVAFRSFFDSRPMNKPAAL